jgi:siroheme decarboxylase
MSREQNMPGIDAADRAIVVATQRGLPLVARPYHAVAEQLGIPVDEVMARMNRMLQNGAIRRIGVIPNHYAIGYQANGMSVWDVPDEVIDELGVKVGDLEFVTHCYRRPRRPPVWRYNLFAMVHGKSREEVEMKVAEIGGVLGLHVRAYDVLYSTRILKKAGLRIAG